MTMGKFSALLKALGVAGGEAADDAAKALALVDSPELAVALKGEPRAAYLQALDEVYGPQAERAAQMGFGPEDWYHGTTAAENFDQFKPTTDNHSNLWGKGSYFTTSADEANFYAAGKRGAPADNARVIPARLKMERPFDFEGFPSKDDIEKLKQAMGEAWQPEYSGVAKYKLFDHLKSNAGTKTATGEALQKAGYDSIKDAVFGSVFEPNQIRSKFAAFDPRFKDSPLLLAGAAAGLPTSSKTSPFEALQDFVGAYKDKVTKPLAASLKEKLTPEIPVNGTSYPTRSGVSDFLLDAAADPVNLLPGAAGAVAGGLELAAELTPEIRRRALERLSK